MSEMDKYYQILGLNPGASEEEIKQAYKDLVNVWHPDRFSDPRLKEKANEKLKDINDAYQKLKSYIAAETEQYTTSDRESHRESKPPPHEPPPKWEKEQSSTTESRGYEEPELSPDEPPKVRMHCSQCGTENSSEAKFCQKCGNPLGQSGRSTPLEANEEGAIWNPNAAANWSLPFTPAFGSYLQMLNWRTLGEPAKASSAQSWFYASLLMLFIYFLIGMFMIDPEVRYIIIWWLSFLYLITWYFAAGRSQGKYVKAKFGTNYPKKPWGQVLLIAVGALICYWVVAFALGFIFRAVTTKDNTHTAMENELEQYRVKDQPQDDLEKYRVARTNTVAKMTEVTNAIAHVASAVVAYHEDLSLWPLFDHADAITIQTSLGVSIPENIIRSISITSPTADQVTIMATITGIDSAVDGKALILRGKFTAKQGVLFMWDGTVPPDYIPKPPKPSPQTSEVTAAVGEKEEIEKIEGLLDRIRQANLKEDIDLFMSCYAKDFKDREERKRATLKFWRNYYYLELSYALKGHSILTDTATAIVEWGITVSPKSGGQSQKSNTVLNVIFKKEGEDWKIKEIIPVR